MAYTPQQSSAAVSLKARCPRCGYDLRGAVDAWTECCPMTGRCAECGLQFAWADLLSQRCRVPTWSVEHPNRVLPYPWRCCKTLVVTFAPWRFWKSIRMTHQPRWGRLALYCLVLPLIFYLLFTAHLAPIAVRGYRQYLMSAQPTQRSLWTTLRPTQTATADSPMRVPLWWAVTRSCVAPFSESSPGTTVLPSGQTVNYPAPHRVLGRHLPPRRFAMSSHLHGEVLAFPLSLAALIPAAFVLLPMTRRFHRIRWSHLVRITLYSIPYLFLPVVYFLFIHDFAVLGRIAPRPTGIFSLLCFVVAPALLFLWWGTAARYYLRIRHAWLTALTLMALSTLLVFALGKLRIIQWHWIDWWLW